MSDTTAALRMACIAMMTSPWYEGMTTVRHDLALRARLGDSRPWGSADSLDHGPLLLQWGARQDPRGKLVALLQSLLDGTPTHAPGMAGLDILTQYPGQEAREQAKELNRV